MDLNWIFETVITVGIGTIAYFMKKQMDESKKADESLVNEIKEIRSEFERKLESEKEKSQQRDSELSKQINDLNTSMPFVYVLKEDWIRVSNATEEKIKGIDNKIDKILDILGTNKKDKESN